MQILTLNFYMYTISGLWQPPARTSKGLRLIYRLYTCLTVFLLYSLTLTQFLDIVLVVDNVDDFISNLLMFMTMVSVSFKVTTAVLHYDDIFNLTKVLLEEPCKVRDGEEIRIQRKFDNFIRDSTVRYSMLAGASVTGATIRSVFSILEGNLPYRAWLPYGCDTTYSFLFTAIQQIVTIILATIVNIGTETLIFGFILQTCAQLEILEHRFQKLTRVRRMEEHGDSFSDMTNWKQGITFSNCIDHHLCIYKYATTVNYIFNSVLFIQFFGSILVLCASVYYISVAPVASIEFFGLVFYTICMFVQIFIYCWSGNEVMIKSADFGTAVYEIDWLSLAMNEKRSLMVIMKRCTIPIRFTSSFLVTLTLDSYTNILKASYSAFNLLQRS